MRLLGLDVLFIQLVHEKLVQSDDEVRDAEATAIFKIAPRGSPREEFFLQLLHFGACAVSPFVVIRQPDAVVAVSEWLTFAGHDGSIHLPRAASAGGERIWFGQYT